MLEKILDIISIFLNFLRLVLWPIIWSNGFYFFVKLLICSCIIFLISFSQMSYLIVHWVSLRQHLKFLSSSSWNSISFGSISRALLVSFGVNMFVRFFSWYLCIWRSRFLFQSLQTDSGTQTFSPEVLQLIVQLLGLWLSKAETMSCGYCQVHSWQACTQEYSQVLCLMGVPKGAPVMSLCWSMGG